MSADLVPADARPAAVDWAELSDEQIETVRRTVAKGATNDELAMLFSLAAKYQLDPFAREVWCIVPLDPSGKRKENNGQPEAAIITTSRDGFLAIANRHPNYRGMTSEVVCEKDDFKRLADGTVEHSYGWDRGKVKGAYALVYRSDRDVPSTFWAKWSEYGEPNARDRDGKVKQWSAWAKYPSALILKVAQSYALKQAFSVSGIVSEEELQAGQAIDEGASTSIAERRRLRTPEVSPRSRGIGRARTQPVEDEPAAQPHPAQDGLEPPDNAGQDAGEGGGLATLEQEEGDDE